MQSESQTTDPSQRRHPAGFFTIFREANFRWFFLGTILGNCASWTQDVTLSWLVYDLTASGAMLGTMSLVRTIATLSLSPMAGIAIDRRPRRSLMFLTNGWFLAINASIGLSLLAGLAQVWPLLLFSLLAGIAQAIDFPLRQTVLFILVTRRMTPNAVGINQTGWAVMRTLGPVIGAFLLVRMGAGGSFLIQAAIHAIIIMIIAQLHFPRPHATEPGTADSRNFAEGFKHIIKNSHTRAFALMGCILRFFIIPVFVVMPAIFCQGSLPRWPASPGLVALGNRSGGYFGRICCHFAQD
jgi:MFS family permease